MSRLRISKDETRSFTLQRYDFTEEKFITFEDALVLLGTFDPTLLELIKRGYMTEKSYDRSKKSPLNK